MAKYDYSADSARSPLPSLPPGLSATGKMGSFKITIPASIDENPPATATFLIEASRYIGESCDLGRRLRDHDDVRDHRGIPVSPTPVH